MIAILNFVHEITDLSIEEGFFNKITDLCSALLYLRRRLNKENWFIFGLPRPQLSLYDDHSKWLYNDPTKLSIICIFFDFIIDLIFI